MTKMRKIFASVSLVVLFAVMRSSGTQDTQQEKHRTKRASIYRRRCRGPVEYNYCGRECKCKDGRRYDCHRVRREFSSMAIRDREAYVRAVKLISTHRRFKADYEKLLTIHKTLFDQQIHEFEYFLPWHRWFLLQYENLLQRVSCRITVPYWDYTLTAGQPFTGAVWNNTNAGLGGDGEGFPGLCVRHGPFRKDEWKLIASAGGGCLRRNFLRDEIFPNLIALQEFLRVFSSAGSLRDFELMLRNDFHNNIHFFIGGFGGTMSTQDSATAPEFFLLHAMVDKIWHDWQKKSPQHTYPAEFMYQTSKMPGTQYHSRDFLNLSQQPQCTAVKYSGPSAAMRPIIARLQTARPSVLRQIPQPDFTQLRKEVIQMFKMRKAEQERLKILHQKFKPTNPLKKGSLHGMDKKLSFSMAKVKAMTSG